MRKLVWLWCLLCVCVALGNPKVPERLFFMNGSFEEDTPNLGWPDHWKKGKGVEGHLVTQPVSDGVKALKFTKGYCVLTQDFQVTNLANSQLSITCDVLSPDGSLFGIVTGCLVKDSKTGKVTWHNRPSPWNVRLSETWRRGKYNITLPKNAVDGRLYIGFYRANSKGTMYLDNLDMTLIPGNTRLTREGMTDLRRLFRDLEYLKNAAGPNLPGLADYEKALWLCTGEDEAFLKNFQEKGQLAKLKAAALKRDTDSDLPMSWLDNPCQRQNFNHSFPKEPRTHMTMTALRGEWQVLGLDIANPEETPKTFDIDFQGLDAFDRVQVRRAVATENWYSKERDLIADPLVLLKDGKLSLEPGEHTRVYVAFKTRKDGEFKVTVRNLTATVRVLPVDLPDTPFGNFQFLYTWQSIFKGPSLADAIRDLKEHYVTDVEFPSRPYMRYKADGTPVDSKMDGTDTERLFKRFGQAGIRSVLFWSGGLNGYKLADGSGHIPFAEPVPGDPKAPERVSAQWKKAYGAMLKTFMDHARKLNLEDMVAVMPWDEINSGKDPAPGPVVKRAKSVFQVSEETEPKLRQYVTCGFWTLPEDLFYVLPHLDAVVIHWPMPEIYRGRVMKSRYQKEVMPRLLAERKKRPLDIWSYRVEAGRSMGPDEERAYPLAMAGSGVTGVGTWAYFVTSKSSWNDTDGNILDYCFVYDGKEDHPLCRKYNVTGERVVPSLRWEALRLGIQDAKILLALKPMAEVEAIRKECDDIAQGKKWNIARILEISRRIRLLYAQQQH